MKNLPLMVGGAGIALFAGVSPAQTGANPQSYPARPIRIIVPNTAGSATDIATRLVAQRLAESMGQQTVVDNRAGASGIDRPRNRDDRAARRLHAAGFHFDGPRGKPAPEQAALRRDPRLHADIPARQSARSCFSAMPGCPRRPSMSWSPWRARSPAS